MKKTLAAVLAAAMALSTATVAFAKDYEVDFSEYAGSIDGIRGLKGEMGDTVKYLINSVTTEDNKVIPGSDIAEAMADGKLTATVIVTSGQNKLSGRPTITAGKTTTSQIAKTVKYVWQDNGTTAAGLATAWSGLEGVKEKVKNMKAGAEVTVICLDAAGRINGDIDQIVTILYKGQPGFNDAMETLVNGADSAWFDEVKDAVAVKTELPQLAVAFAHTYSTSASEATMKLRFTAKKDVTLGGETYNKGDTISTEEVKFKAEYYELSNYYKDMQLTTQEVSDNRVILNGSNLYDAIGDSKFTITFGDDIAMFEGKAAVNQKNLNLYYSLATIDEIVDAYPEVDFTFLTFKGNGAPVFQNTGKMVFAAKDKNTTVYSWDGEVLTPISDPKNYDDTYKTVTVSGIKKLGTYVIADQILEVEEEPEEPAEPVDSTPVAEPDDEGENPNTGAC